MVYRSRAAALLAFFSLPAVLLAGCGTGSGAGNSGTLTPIQPSSYVTLPPATTTTTTTLAPGAESDGPTNSEQEQQYTVVAGDSVYRIAEIHGVEPDVLATYNKWPEGIQHPLTPGDVVLIPPGSLVPGSGGTGGGSGEVGGGDSGDAGDTGGDEDDSGDTDSEAGCAYTIVAGDNPSKVAEMFDITVEELSAANSESVMSSFLVGATLQIPPGADCSAAEN